MGVSSDSSECHERIRLVVEGLEGVQQIKDDTVVREQIIQTGDQDLIKQQKTIVNLPF